MPRNPPPGVKFKPGNNNNPLGARAHNPVKKYFKRLTEDQLQEVMELMLFTHPSKLKDLQIDYDTTTLKAWIAAAAIKGINEGELGPLMAILDRVLGRIKERVEISTPNPVSQLTDEELNKRIADLASKTI
jgi:hypothetical protein